VEVHRERYHLRDRISLEQYLQQQSYTTEARLTKVFFSQEVVQHTYHDRYHYGFVQEESKEGGTEMWFMVASEEYFSRWLLMFTNAVKVLEPISLKQNVQKLIRELQQNYF